MTIIAHRGGSISGQVLYSDGTPAYGVAIEALRKVDDKYVPIFDFRNIEQLGSPANITDEKGNYKLSALPPGEYIIRALEAVKHGGKQGMMSFMNPFAGYYSSLFSTFYPSAMAPGEARKIEVKANQEIAAADIKIMQRSSHTIRGKLIDRVTKEPLANKTISLSKVGNPFSFIDFGYMRGSQGRLETQTDKEGIWELSNIPNGDYKINTRFSSYGYRDYSSDYQNIYGSPVSTGGNTYAVNAANMATRSANMARVVTNTVVTTTSVVNKSTSRRGNSNTNTMNGDTAYRVPKQYVDTEKDIQVTDVSQPEIVMEILAASKITGKIEKDNKAKISNYVVIVARDEQQQKETEAYLSSEYRQSSKNSFGFFT